MIYFDQSGLSTLWIRGTKWVSIVMKNMNNSRCVNCTLVKTEIQAVLDSLNNFQLIMKVDLLWPKWSNYAMKLRNEEINSLVSIIMKNVNNSRCINCTFMKIKILAVLDSLNNFQLIMKVDLLWPKWSNYAMKLRNEEIIRESVLLWKTWITLGALTVPLWKSRF